MKPCPRCDRELHPQMFGEIAVQACGGCEGLFLEQGVIQQVIADHVLAEPLLATLPRREIRVIPRPGEKMYLKCPECRTVMNRRQFATGAGIVIDVCKPHGTFFDAGELPAIIEYVRKGGLDRSAKKDREDARQRARIAAISIEPGPRYEPDGLDAGIAFADLLISLFG
jgi:Zn-finger nucleic acid-binding protein